MQEGTHEISHVSDTALMVAGCRAMETVRPDGLVRDPFAERLAGERGLGIARTLPGLERMCFGIGIRSCFLDHLVPDAISQYGIATVLSIGAGLDSRPWRLELPAALRWIEVDFPEMLDYKDAVMDSVAPRCRRERMSADITEAAGREKVFAAAGDGPTLMITEGLLMYLPGATVEALAANTSAGYWLLDAISAAMADVARMDTFQSVESVRAADHMDGGQILDAADRHGWVALRRLTYAADVMTYARERVMAMFRNVPPDQMPKPLPPGDPSGVSLLGRKGAS